MNSRIMTGWVMSQKPRLDDWCGGYMVIVIPELGDRQVTVSNTLEPLTVQAGIAYPEFTDEVTVWEPGITDAVVAEIDCSGKIPKVLRWGSAEAWQHAEDEINARAIYRVVRENRFKGQLMSNTERPTGDSARGEIAFTGNLDQLIAESPRDGLRVSAVDKFAPTYKVGPVTAKNLFQVKCGDSDWKTCADPRPFPIGPQYRVMHCTDGGFRQIARGTALEINFSFPRGERDPLARREAQGGPGSFIYWELKSPPNMNEPDEADKKFIWVQVADPRPMPVEYALPKTEVKPKVSVAAPKQEKPKQFASTLKRFAELTLA